MVSVNRVYGETGKLVEKYDVMSTGRSGGGGEYPLQDGFGWTNGVMSKLMAVYPKDSAYSDVNQCPNELDAPLRPITPRNALILRLPLPAHSQLIARRRVFSRF